MNVHSFHSREDFRIPFCIGSQVIAFPILIQLVIPFIAGSQVSGPDFETLSRKLNLLGDLLGVNIFFLTRIY